MCVFVCACDDCYSGIRKTDGAIVFAFRACYVQVWMWWYRASGMRAFLRRKSLHRRIHEVFASDYW
jgi:hypothetical protein